MDLFLNYSKKRLIKLLDEAELILSNYSGGYSGSYIDARKFLKDLKSSIKSYKSGDNSELSNFHLWFAPTCHWDDFVGSEGLQIGNEIFRLVGKLNKNVA